MKRLVFISAILLIFSYSLFADNVGTWIKVPGMTWPGTAYEVRVTLKKLKGVKEVKTDTSKEQVYVKYDDTQNSIDNILNILKQEGFNAKMIIDYWCTFLYTAL